MKIKFLHLFAIAMLVLVQSSWAQTKRPNIIFVMSDDHTSQAIGAYGGRLETLDPTPNIDMLAENGLRFKNAFCTNAICTPSRANIITGQYSQTNGILDLDQHLETSKQYLPQEMKKLGYSTAMVGKWHLGKEPVHFDYYKVLKGQGKYFNPKFREKGKGKWPNNYVKSEGHSSDVITDISIDYLKGLDKSKPFFLMHHYKAPHDMFEAAPRYADYLKDTEIPMPASMFSQPHFGSEGTRGKNDSLRNYIGTSVSSRNTVEGRRNNFADFWFKDEPNDELRTYKAYQKYLKDYLRCVKGVDDGLGRLFAYLKKEGLWENTIIIYTGDQGMMLGEHDFIDKRWMYDESMRMPFIVHAPMYQNKGTAPDLLINNTDYAPTIIELAGGATPKYMQGKSFAKTVKGQKQGKWRKSTYYRYWMHIIHHYVPAHFGIRTPDYKLIFFYGKHYLPKEKFKGHYWAKGYEGVDRETPHSWEFYDLKNDPEELHNRYNDPKFQKIITNLKKDLKKQRKDLNETDKDYPAIEAIIEKHWND